jgi:leucyl aminopeptidase
MKFTRKIFIIIIVSGIIFSVSGCKKEDSEKIRKEALVHALIDDINSDSLEANVVWMQNFGTRFSLADSRKSVAERIKKRFVKMGFANAELDSFYVYKTYKNVSYEQWQYNVIATIEGTVFPDSLCVIGAHYDDIVSSGDPFTVAPGANDNASGVSSVLEIARVMKKHNYVPESTIKFIAFGAEEIGLLGSKDFAADPNGFSSEIRFMLNFDMVAYEPGDNSASWYVNILDYDNSHNLRKEVEQISVRYTLLQYKNDNTYNKSSDSYPFFTNGYKALFFFSDKGDPYYHSTNDLAVNFNFEYCREIVKIGCAVLADKN